MKNQPTNLGFVSVQVRDMERSKKFYSEILNFQIGPKPNEHAEVFKVNDGAIFAIRTPLVDLDAVEKLGHGVALWFSVAGIDEFYKTVQSKNAVVLKPLSETPFGKTFVVADPDGYAITIQQK